MSASLIGGCHQLFVCFVFVSVRVVVMGVLVFTACEAIRTLGAIHQFKHKLFYFQGMFSQKRMEWI